MIITLNIHIPDVAPEPIPDVAPEPISWWFANKIEAFINGHCAYIYEIPAGRKQWKLFNIMTQQALQTRVRTSEAALICLLNRIYYTTKADHEGRYRDGFNPKWLRNSTPQ